MGTEFVEKFIFARELPFLLEPLHDLMQQGRGPFAVEENFGISVRYGSNLNFRLVNGVVVERQ